MAPAQFNSRSDPRGSLKRLRTVAHRSLAGSTAIVTGGNAGIGLSTARSLLQRGAHVVLACRSQAKALEAIEDLHTSPPFTDVDGQPIPLGTIEFSALDLSTLQSCRDFAARWSSEGRGPIDLLVCNAGCIYLERVITPDGFEMMYETNYLSHALLTLLLLPHLAPAARIVNVSSFGAYRGPLNLANLNAELLPSKWPFLRKFSLSMDVYSASKLYQVAFTVSLQALLDKAGKSIVVQAVHPGVVASSIASASHYGFPEFVNTALTKMFSWVGRTTFQGAQTTLWVALSDEAGEQDKKGKYWADCAVAVMPDGASDPALLAQFFERTLKDSGMEGWTLE